MDKITIVVTGVEKVIANLNKIYEHLEAALTVAIGESAEMVEKEEHEHHPYKDITGYLTEQTKAQQAEVNGTEISAEVIADTDYAAAVEYGSVNRAPKPFLVPALEVSKPAIINKVKNKVEETLRG